MLAYLSLAIPAVSIVVSTVLVFRGHMSIKRLKAERARELDALARWQAGERYQRGA